MHSFVKFGDFGFVKRFENIFNQQPPPIFGGIGKSFRTILWLDSEKSDLWTKHKKKITIIILTETISFHM